jgi:hypothetical protein
MAHIHKTSVHETGIEKRDGYASPNKPVTAADLPKVPSGPAQGATSGQTSTGNADSDAQD